MVWNHQLRSAAMLAAVLLTAAVVWPSLGSLRDAGPRLIAPLDPSLRVPLGAASGRARDLPFAPGDRVLDASLGDGGRLATPRDRAELYELLLRAPSVDSIGLHLVRDQEIVSVRAAVVAEPGWKHAAQSWPTLFLGIAFLAFGLVLGLGSHHPVAGSLFAVSWCVGTTALCQLDLLLPADPGIFGAGLLRSRLGLISLMLLPASMLHLAMRFPVVATRFRSSAAVAVPYAFWLFPAAFTQVHVEDAAFLNSIERITLGATFVAAGILAAASIVYAKTMTPIERARAKALVAGLGASASIALVHFFHSGRPGPVLRAVSTLSLLVFPAAISWAIVRYRLLDPPTWLQRTALNGLSALVALLLATATMSFLFSHVQGTSFVATAEVVPVALLTTLLYQGFQVGLRRFAGERLLSEGAFERFLETASRELAACRSPESVLNRLSDLIQRHLGATGVDWGAVDRRGRSEIPSLWSRGVELWRDHGSPKRQLAWARGRAEDPGPHLAEAVLPLTRPSGQTVLVVVSSRSDGLPYSDEQRRMLESALHVATTALEAAATTADLEARVAEKTASLERALADRQAVVRAARAISEADRPEAVLATIRGFAAARGAAVRWSDIEAGGTPAARLEMPGAPPRVLFLEGNGNSDIAPQLETLCSFGALAIARLDLLSELKREVERQAAEIADITSTRLHAEFVRGVAHELRKPTEEVRHRVEELCADSAPPVSETLQRIRLASREMSRRLDLLLFHSGIRLDRQRIDLVRVVDDAVESVRSTCPEREYRIEHDLVRLPMIGDPSRLASVVENLLDNAVKATTESQRILVRTALEPRDGHHEPWVRLEVEDEGRGIPADQLEEVFEPGVAFAPSGFGLGLSLCRQITQMHGGTIEGESQAGRTEFRIRLPQFRTSLGEGNDGDSGDSSS